MIHIYFFTKTKGIPKVSSVQMDTNEQLSSLTCESYGASLKCPLEESLLWHNFFLLKFDVFVLYITFIYDAVSEWPWGKFINTIKHQQYKLFLNKATCDTTVYE